LQVVCLDITKATIHNSFAVSNLLLWAILSYLIQSRFIPRSIIVALRIDFILSVAVHTQDTYIQLILLILSFLPF